MGKEKAKRMSVTMPESTRRVIDKLAEKYGVSSSALVQMLIERGLTIEAIAEGGGEIFVRMGNKELLLANEEGHFIGFKKLLE